MKKKRAIFVALAVAATGLLATPTPARAAIDQTWLSNHCRVDMNGNRSTVAEMDPNTGLHAIQIVVIREFPNDFTQDIPSYVEPKIEAADSYLAKSHPTVKQHWKMACRASSTGAWLGLHYSYADATRAHPYGHDADTNNNLNVGCEEAKDWAVNWNGYNGKHRRYIFLLDAGIEGDYLGESCSFGWNGVGYNTDDDRIPGTANLMNESSGYAVLSRPVWSSTDTVRFADSFGHELYHSLGAVHDDAPGACYDEGCNRGHTNDSPDIMANSGYGTPTNCTDNATAAIPEDPNAYMDCGRDSYWAPNPGPDNYLCTNYNIATDTHYLFNRQARTLDCPAA